MAIFICLCNNVTNIILVQCATIMSCRSKFTHWSLLSMDSNNNIMIYKDSICAQCLASSPHLRDCTTSEDTKEEELFCVYCVNHGRSPSDAVCLYLGTLPLIAAVGQPACMDCVITFKELARRSGESCHTGRSCEARRNSFVPSLDSDKESEGDRLEAGGKGPTVSITRRSLSQKGAIRIRSGHAKMHSEVKGCYTPSFFAKKEINPQESILVETLPGIVFGLMAGEDKELLLYESTPTDPERFCGQVLHSACDGRGALLILISLEGAITIGGYTSCGWQTTVGTVADRKCALFHAKDGRVTVHGVAVPHVASTEDGFAFGKEGNDLSFSFKDGGEVKCRFLLNLLSEAERDGSFGSVTESLTIKVNKVAVYGIIV